MQPSDAGAPPVLRVARASSDLDAARRFYCEALGLRELGSFSDHDGFDGLIAGLDGAGWHLELVHERDAPVTRPSVEDLLVLYEPDTARFAARRTQMLAAGYIAVRSNNPYWDRFGVTFEDADGYRTVIANRDWPR